MKFQQLMEQNRIPFSDGGDHRHVRSGWIGVDCPFCGPGTGKMHLGYNEDSGAMNCWQCGTLKIIDVLQSLLNCQPREASMLSRQLDRVTFQKIDVKRLGLKIPENVKAMGHTHTHYLESRNLDPDEMKRIWNLKGITHHYRLGWRIFIPIYGNGNMLSWTTRAIGKGIKPRYVSASPREEAVNHRDILYGIDYCRHACIIHEGPADVWTTGPGSVALLGGYPTPNQMLQLIGFPIRVVCLDTTNPNAKKLYHELSVFPGRTDIVTLESGSDPNEADKEEIAELRALIT